MAPSVATIALIKIIHTRPTNAIHTRPTNAITTQDTQQRITNKEVQEHTFFVDTIREPKNLLNDSHNQVPDFEQPVELLANKFGIIRFEPEQQKKDTFSLTSEVEPDLKNCFLQRIKANRPDILSVEAWIHYIDT